MIRSGRPGLEVPEQAPGALVAVEDRARLAARFLGAKPALDQFFELRRRWGGIPALLARPAGRFLGLDPQPEPLVLVQRLAQIAAYTLEAPAIARPVLDAIRVTAPAKAGS